MKTGLPKVSIFALLLPPLIKSFRDHHTIRRQTKRDKAKTIAGESGSRPSMGGTADDPVDEWLSNVFERYNNLESNADTRAKGRKSSSSRRSRRRSKTGPRKNGAAIGNVNKSLYDVKSDDVESWLGNIYDHYDLPKMSNTLKIGRPVKGATPGTTNKGSNRAKSDPVNDWLTSIFDQYGLSERQQGMKSSASSSSKTSTPKGGGESPSTGKGKQGSKAKRTRQPQSIFPSFHVSASPSPLAGTSTLPTMESFSPTCDEKSNTKSSKSGTGKGKGKGRLSSKGKSQADSSSLCASAIPSPDIGSTASPSPINQPHSSSKNTSDSKNSKNAQPSEPSPPSRKNTNKSRSKPSKRAPTLPAPIAAPVSNPNAPITPSAPLPAPRPAPAPVSIPSPDVTPSTPTVPSLPVALPAPTPVTPSVPVPAPVPVPRPAPVPVPSPIVIPTTPTISPAPTGGTIVRSNACSDYESVVGMPSEDDSTQAASLTCAHFVEYISTTLETPFIVLDDVSCTEAATTTDPNRICFDITVVAAANSEVIPSLDDVNTLICIALLPPEVDALIADLSALPANNPFSTTSALTCDIVAASTPSPSVRQTPVPSTALSPTPVPRRSEEPAPTNAPEISTDNPTNAPTQKRATGTHVDASPFTLTYDATAGPGPSDFREAGLVTCDHVVSVIRNFFLGSQFITLESAFCNGNSITTNNDTMLIEYEVNFIFAPESVAVPTMSDIDSLIEITLSDPVVQNLYADLQGLPSSNPLSATTGVTYQVSRRILVEQIVPASFASARFSTRTLGVAMLFLFVPLFLRGKFTVVFISI